MTRLRLALVLVLFAALVSAQKKTADQTRSVEGVVTSSEDKPLAGAVVQMKNTKNLQIRSFITQPDGSYYFHGLSPDVDYELRANFNGESSRTHTLSSFDTRKNATVNLKLEKK